MNQNEILTRIRGILEENNASYIKTNSLISDIEEIQADEDYLSYSWKVEDALNGKMDAVNEVLELLNLYKNQKYASVNVENENVVEEVAAVPFNEFGALVDFEQAYNLDHTMMLKMISEYRKSGEFARRDLEDLWANNRKIQEDTLGQTNWNAEEISALKEAFFEDLENFVSKVVKREQIVNTILSVSKKKEQLEKEMEQAKNNKLEVYNNTISILKNNYLDAEKSFNSSLDQESLKDFVTEVKALDATYNHVKKNYLEQLESILKELDPNKKLSINTFEELLNKYDGKIASTQISLNKERMLVCLLELAKHPKYNGEYDELLELFKNSYSEEEFNKLVSEISEYKADALKTFEELKNINESILVTMSSAGLITPEIIDNSLLNYIDFHANMNASMSKINQEMINKLQEEKVEENEVKEEIVKEETKEEVSQEEKSNDIVTPEVEEKIESLLSGIITVYDRDSVEWNDFKRACEEQIVLIDSRKTKKIKLPEDKLPKNLPWYQRFNPFSKTRKEAQALVNEVNEYNAEKEAIRDLIKAEELQAIYDKYFGLNEVVKNDTEKAMEKTSELVTKYEELETEAKKNKWFVMDSKAAKIPEKGEEALQQARDNVLNSDSFKSKLELREKDASTLLNMAEDYSKDIAKYENDIDELTEKLEDNSLNTILYYNLYETLSSKDKTKTSEEKNAFMESLKEHYEQSDKIITDKFNGLNEEDQAYFDSKMKEIVAEVSSKRGPLYWVEQKLTKLKEENVYTNEDGKTIDELQNELQDKMEARDYSRQLGVRKAINENESTLTPENKIFLEDSIKEDEVFAEFVEQYDLEHKLNFNEETKKEVEPTETVEEVEKVAETEHVQEVEETLPIPEPIKEDLVQRENKSDITIKYEVKADGKLVKHSSDKVSKYETMKELLEALKELDPSKRDEFITQQLEGLEESSSKSK